MKKFFGSFPLLDHENLLIDGSLNTRGNVQNFNIVCRFSNAKHIRLLEA